jgi:hypothetical protein
VSDAAAARRARVWCVVEAGRRIADAADPLGREARVRLEASSGLSPRGVALALGEHLEIDPAPAHLDALLARATAPRCHVVLSANVCTAALRAVALAVATSPRASIRPSRRDPVLTELLVQTLAADPAFAGVVERVAEVAPAPGDELHLYGADETMAILRARAPAGVVVRAHGTGLGLAVVGAEVALDAAAAALARDVVPFDQRGCLSPRAALVEGGPARAEAFAEALDRALTALGAAVPRGPLDAAARAELALYRAALQAVGLYREGPHHAIGLDLEPRALALPPAARVVHVVAADAATASALVAPWADHLTTVGSDDDGAVTRAVRALAPGARRARLGFMQRPPLDGPVDLRSDQLRSR